MRGPLPAKRHLTPQAVHKACGRKRRFTTARHARQVAQRFGQRVYRCPHCAGWHLATR